MAYTESQELEVIKLDSGVPCYYFVKYVRAQNGRHVVKYEQDVAGGGLVEEEVGSDELRPRQARPPSDAIYIEREVVDVKQPNGAWKVAEVTRRDVDLIRTLHVRPFGSWLDSQTSVDLIRPHYEYRAADGVWEKRGPPMLPRGQGVTEAGTSSRPNTATTGTSTGSGGDTDAPPQKCFSQNCKCL